MAFNNIKPLRQRNIFDNFSLGDLSSGYSYGQEEEQDPDPTNRSSFRSEPTTSSLRTSNPNPTGIGSDVSSSREFLDPRESPEQRTQRLLDAIGKVYTPSNTARDRFGNLLDNAPEREEPSFARRLVAAGVGLGNKSRGIPGGIEEQEKVLYAPYMRDLAAWNAKVTPFSQAAQQENSANSIERQLAGNVATGVWNQDRIDSQNRIADEKNATARQKIENDFKTQQDKIEIAKAVQRGAKAVSSGEYIILTYTDGRQPVNTGVKTTNYSPVELANINNAADMAQTVQQGQNQANVARIQGQNAVTTKSTPGASTSPKAGDEGKIRQDVLQKIKDTGTSDERRWIISGPGGLDLKPPPEVGGGKYMGVLGSAWTQADVDSYNRVANAAHPGTALGVNPGNLGGNSSSLGNQPPIIERSGSNPNLQRKSTDGGKTWLHSSDGGKTWSK